MEAAAHTHAASSPQSVAHTAAGGKSVPAVPVVQQQPDEKEEAPVQKMPIAQEVSPVKFSPPSATVPSPAPDLIQSPFALQKKPATVALPQDISPFAVTQKKANETGMPDDLKSGIENMSGFSMDDVKVHYNSARPAQLQALAYAQANEIHIGPGQEKHLPHEAWHVVQQKQGRVKPLPQMKNKVNNDEALEKEADTMGTKAFQFVSAQPVMTLNNTIAQSHEVIQRKEPWDSLAKQKWDDTIEAIEKYAFETGNFDIEAADIIAYLRQELNIEPPNEQNFKKEDYQEYFRELEDVKAGEAIEYADKLLQYRNWLNHEEEDSHSDDDEEEERYYSSEEDETPEDEGEFGTIVSVIRELNDMLDEYISDLKSNAKFKEIASNVIDTILKHKQTAKFKKEKKFPDSFNVVPIGGMEDWLSFAHTFKDAKSGGRSKQKPTVYNINFKVWDKPTYQEIRFRGRQLKDAKGGEGRSWPAIALALHQLAIELGACLLKASDVKTQTEKGTQILAAAMLAILGGRGNEVLALMNQYKIPTEALLRFEAVVLEFFALTMGIENIRMEFTQLDTVLHLNNIATGATLGNTEKKYNFVNVFSSARENDKGEMVHVYDRALYRWHRRRQAEDFSGLNEHEIEEQAEDRDGLEVKKELTLYKGHRMLPLEESLQRPRVRGQIKSSKSIGKSIYSHSAGHGKTDKLLSGVKTEVAKLWDQVRPVKDKEERRKLHQERLFSMGPIRLYNLFANLISRNKEALEGFSPKEIASFIMQLYVNFVEGTVPGGNNPFHNEIEVISGSDFGSTVLKILEGKDDLKPDEAVVKVMEKWINGDKKAIFSLDKIDVSTFKIALIHVLRSSESGANHVLHLAVELNHPDLIEKILSLGVDIEAEDSEGRTALAYALDLNSKGEKNETSIKILLGIQDKQKRRKKTQLPRDWQVYTRGKMGQEWLTDVEVHQGLLAANLPDTHIAPAVNITDNPDVLAEFIRDNYLDQMAQGAVAQNTVIPINFNNAHWATLVIRQNPDRRASPDVYFFDSMGEDEEKLALIKLMLRMTGVYTRVDNITDLSAYLQDDGYTCGTWMIESATRIVTILENGGTVKELQDSLIIISAVVKELHKEKVQFVQQTRKKKLDSETSEELGITGKYHSFKGGEQEYSELWIEKTYNELYNFPSQLEELAGMLMINYEDVDEKMQKIYLNYIYKSYHVLSKTSEVAGWFEEELQEITKFLKDNK